MIRERCRGSFEQRIGVLEEIADGEPVQRLRLANGTETETKVSAQPSDRIRAVEALGKFGLSASRVDLEEVNALLARTLEVIITSLPPAEAEKLIALIDPIWRAA